MSDSRKAIAEDEEDWGILQVELGIAGRVPASWNSPYSKFAKLAKAANSTYGFKGTILIDFIEDTEAVLVKYKSMAKEQDADYKEYLRLKAIYG